MHLPTSPTLVLLTLTSFVNIPLIQAVDNYTPDGLGVPGSGIFHQTDEKPSVIQCHALLAATPHPVSNGLSSPDDLGEVAAAQSTWTTITTSTSTSTSSTSSSSSLSVCPVQEAPAVPTPTSNRRPRVWMEYSPIDQMMANDKLRWSHVNHNGFPRRDHGRIWMCIPTWCRRCLVRNHRPRPFDAWDVGSCFILSFFFVYGFPPLLS